MHRTQLALAATAIAAATLMAPATAAADVPEYQRVIFSRHADAASVDQTGCLKTEIWVSTSDNVFGGRPGPVNKQGLTSALVRQIDVCGEGVAAAAAPPEGDVVFDGIGQTLDPLQTTPRFDRAWIDVTLPVLDEVSNTTVPVHLDLEWTPVGEFDRDTVHTHAKVPHGAIVNSHSQTLMADAAVSGTVTVDGTPYTFEPVGDAHLQQVKYGCQLIDHPQGEADLSC